MYESVINDEYAGYTLSDRIKDIEDKEDELDSILKSLYLDVPTTLDIDSRMVELFCAYEKRGFAVGISLGIRLGVQFIAGGKPDNDKSTMSATT